jgi:hypothetical protein
MGFGPRARIAGAALAAVVAIAGAYAVGRATGGDGGPAASAPVATAAGEGIRAPSLGAAAPLPGMRAPEAPTVVADTGGGVDSGSGEVSGSGGVAPSGGSGSTGSTGGSAPSTTTPPPPSSGGDEVISEGGGVD